MCVCVCVCVCSCVFVLHYACSALYIKVALNSGSMLFVIGSDTSTCTTQLQRLRSKVPESDVIEVKVSERTDVQSVLPDLATSPALPRVIILSCFGQEAKAVSIV